MLYLTWKYVSIIFNVVFRFSVITKHTESFTLDCEYNGGVCNSQVDADYFSYSHFYSINLHLNHSIFISVLSHWFLEREITQNARFVARVTNSGSCVAFQGYLKSHLISYSCGNQG
jgi:hypothetical protein